MNFDHSPKARELQARLWAFMRQHVYPAERDYTAELAANRADREMAVFAKATIEKIG